MGLKATKICVYGMYDMHLFEEIPGETLYGVIDNWRWFNATRPHPAIVGGNTIDDMGLLLLCPILVLSERQELRRVGTMVFPDAPDANEKLNAWLKAAIADEDVLHLIGEPRRESTSAWRAMWSPLPEQEKANGETQHV